MLRASAIGLSSGLTPLLLPFLPSLRSSPWGPLPRTLTIPGTTVIHLLYFPKPNRGWVQSTILQTLTSTNDRRELAERICEEIWLPPGNLWSPIHLIRTRQSRSFGMAVPTHLLRVC
ncbi:hypothetical protein BDP55DRAFT_243204 [Colletotrichum godetiae]|uniref:Uncharacterized protein n=1 Tax=Colletotrichum godetiae TaxID=1209918 RepID=A0AAJ0AJ60_9PEZI|nr:uncharacterized protein BDP55DRAFT_243204 [Colletotrichum godetiae]KAK1672676.1 hypothetical protein BDP55DRAFT_243204 [Colletotrichum godetiae]